MCQRFKKIFAYLSEDESRNLMALLESENLQAVRDYLILLKGKKDELKRETTASVKEDNENSSIIDEISATFEIKSTTPVKSAFDVAKSEDYKWYRYAGNNMKSMSYDGNTVNILPREVFGISNTESNNVYEIIIPATKVIYNIDENNVVQLTEESKIYNGNINNLLDIIRND